MSQKTEYLFQFFRAHDTAEPIFSRSLPFEDDETAVREGALFLRSQQQLPQPASVVVVCRADGAVKPLGRWVWAKEARWTPA